MTCDGIYFLNPSFNNCGGCITGCNVSDNGTFGLSRAQKIKIINPVCVGGVNSVNGAAIQLGAVNDALVENPSIEGHAIGIVINDGNAPASASATNWTIINPQIRNCNPSNNFHSIHPGILLSGSGGTVFGTIVLGDLYDDQTTKTQRYPIGFDGGAVWDQLQIINARLSADTGNGATSIILNGGTTLGSNVLITNNRDYSGSSPAQNGVSIAQGGTGASSASAALANLGAVAKSGDTMSGALTVQNIITAQTTGANKVSHQDNDNHTWESDGGGWWRFRNAWTNNGQGYLWFASAGSAAAVQEIMRLTGTGQLGLGTNAPSGLFDVNDNRIRIRTAKTPSSATDTGNTGEVCWDANFIMYV